MHNLFTPALFGVIPLLCIIFAYPGYRARALPRTQARLASASAEEARSRDERFIANLREYNSNNAVTGVIAVTGVTAPPVSRAPSKELFFVSPEAAAKNEIAVVEPVTVAIATAVVNRDPL